MHRFWMRIESLGAAAGLQTLTRCLSQLMPTRDLSPLAMGPLGLAGPQMRSLVRTLEQVGLVALRLVRVGATKIQPQRYPTTSKDVESQHQAP